MTLKRAARPATSSSGASNIWRSRPRSARSAVYDVLFYYTDLKTRDDKITDDELTPLVFRGHELAGVGYGFLGRLAPKYRGLQ